MSRLTIAVDGPGSSGKGTVARALAQRLGYRYVDTGAMYRALALVAHRRKVSWDDADALERLAASLAIDFRWDGDILRVLVDGQDVTSAIRQDEIGQGASQVSTHPGVRRAFLDIQRAMGREGGVVMDGRDIGTVVLPDADLKVFLDAGLEERARRRHDELLRRGEVVSFQEVKEGLRARDRQDRNRPVAPLRQADDAIYVDSTRLSVAQVVERALALVHGHDDA